MGFLVFSPPRYAVGAIHSTKIQTGPTGKRGPPQKVDQFFRNFSGWTEPTHWVLDRNFRKFWLNRSRPVPVLDTLCLSSMQCGCPRYAVPVRDTLCMSAIRCACPKYAMPVLNTLCLSSIRCACPKYAVPVLDTLCLSAMRCACPKYVELSFRCASSRYAVPVVNTLSWPCSVPVPIRNWILTLIPLYIPNIQLSTRTHPYSWNLICPVVVKNTVIYCFVVLFR